ncbi:Clr5 domain-containing protein [Apiospora sp. TS-2023a]
MAPAIIYANQPKDFSLWDAHRDDLKKLYLMDKMPLREVKKEMELKHGFPSDFTESMYETTLREHLKFRKNLKGSDWETIATHLDKRQRRGKESEVAFLGNRLTDKRVAKEVSRHRPAMRDGLATPPLPASIAISTPPAVSPEAVPDTQSPEAPIMSFPRDDDTTAGTMLDIRRISSTVSSSVEIPPNSRYEMCHLLEGQFSPARMKTLTNELAVKLQDLLRVHFHQINTNICQSLEALHQMTGSPMTFGLNSSVGMLLQASHMLSNDDFDKWDLHEPFMVWIELGADRQLLQEFFSMNTPTTIAVWFSLVRDGPQAFVPTDAVAELWFEIGLTIDDGQPIRDNIGWCFDVLDRMSPAGQWKMLNRISQVGEMVFNEDWPKYRSAMLKQQLRNSMADPNLTKTIIDSGVSLPKSISIDWHRSFWDRMRHSFKAINMEAFKELAKVGVQVVPGTTNDSWQVLCHDPNEELRRSSESIKLSQWDVWAEIVSSYDESIKKCVTLVGIAAAASKGLDSLSGYVRGKLHPLLPTKEEVLQIALSYMSDIGIQSIVHVLLQYGVDAEVKGLRNSRVISEVKRLGKHPFRTPTVAAVRRGDIGMVKLLAEYGADFTRRDVAEAIILEKSDIPEGYDCATEYYETLINLLLDFGLNLEQNGTRIMLLAVGLIGYRHKPDYDLIKVLQHRGVKWNKHVSFYTGDFWKGWEWWIEREIDRADLLHLAIRRHCSVEIVRYLLNEGVQMHSRPCEFDGKSILQAALEDPKYRGVELVQLLLDHLEGDRETDPAWPEILELSVRTSMHKMLRIYGDMRLYHYFKGLGAMPPDPTDPTKAQRRFGLVPDLIWFHAKDETIADIWNNGDGFEKLHDEDRDRILIKTIRSGGLSWARILIELGANVNSQTIFYDRLYTPLQQACFDERPLWFIRYLIGKGAKTTFNEDTGYTALHMAAENGWLNLVSLSLENGANVNAIWTPDPDAWIDSWYLVYREVEDILGGEYRQPGFTALDIASAYGRLDVVKFLLNVGGKSASPGQTGFAGALNLAEENQFQGVAMLLRQESAKLGGICEELQ